MGPGRGKALTIVACTQETLSGCDLLLPIICLRARDHPEADPERKIPEQGTWEDIGRGVWGAGQGTRRSHGCVISDEVSEGRDL